jgi:16S rRNA (uracil1498-N3)-methyltransferase
VTSNRFFVAKAAVVEDRIELEGREHHHLSRVARVKPGDRVRLFDEDGTDYVAEVEDARGGVTKLRVLEREAAPRPGLRVVLAQALLKPKSMELVIQKATEVGVSAIVPLTAARSVARADDKAELKAERWRAIAREAAKQCKNGLPPDIEPPCTIEQCLRRDRDGRRFFLSENGGRPWRDVLKEGLDGGPPSPVLILIGPEGGWAPAEEEIMRRKGCEAASLGERVMRAETAALCAASSVILMWGR